VTISTLPSRSVRKTAISCRAASVASVAGAGWPYSLPSPDEMIAAVGRMTSRRPGVVDEFEP